MMMLALLAKLNTPPHSPCGLTSNTTTCVLDLLRHQTLSFHAHSQYPPCRRGRNPKLRKKQKKNTPGIFFHWSGGSQQFSFTCHHFFSSYLRGYIHCDAAGSWIFPKVATSGLFFLGGIGRRELLDDMTTLLCGF